MNIKKEEVDLNVETKNAITKTWQDIKGNIFTYPNILNELQNGLFFIDTIKDLKIEGDFIKGELGVLNDKIVIIFELNDKSFRAYELKESNEKFTIYVKKVIVEIDEYVVDANFKNINHLNKVYSNSGLKEPDIDASNAINQIQLWKRNCNNWFNNTESNEIPNYFLIPNSDIKENSLCFFGFRNDSILNKDIPSLIFVDRNIEEINVDTKSLISSNTSDWSMPSPPYEEDSIE
ncbi:hypothetical protein [Aureivirga marina]|uniref:hypothetical protein n=1 Tax=Aureivirga marina TaxID=1182451 RepID=UPI0018C9D8C4|nr:hypothetical protein [Aureivirga marina]